MTDSIEPTRSQSCVTDLRSEGPRPREKRAIEHMRDNPQGDHCSRCGQPVRVGPETRACLCAECTHLLAQLWAAGYWKNEAKPKRLCPDCGEAIAKRHRYCDTCAQQRARKRDRDKKRRRRK